MQEKVKIIPIHSEASVGLRNWIFGKGPEPIKKCVSKCHPKPIDKREDTWDALYLDHGNYIWLDPSYVKDVKKRVEQGKCVRLYQKKTISFGIN